jgi:hypothetical protein
MQGSEKGSAGLSALVSGTFASDVEGGLEVLCSQVMMTV